MSQAVRLFLAAVLLMSAGPMNAHAQTAADVDSSLDSLFGSHTPYREFLQTLQKAVANEDKPAVAALVDYPLEVRIGGKAVRLKDAEHFVADYDKIVTPKVKQAIANQDYAALFVNWQGVMIGDGEVWFSGVGDEGVVRITAINH